MRGAVGVWQVCEMWHDGEDMRGSRVKGKVKADALSQGGGCHLDKHRLYLLCSLTVTSHSRSGTGCGRYDKPVPGFPTSIESVHWLCIISLHLNHTKTLSTFPAVAWIWDLFYRTDYSELFTSCLSTIHSVSGSTVEGGDSSVWPAIILALLNGFIQESIKSQPQIQPISQINVWTAYSILFKHNQVSGTCF